MLGGIFVGGFLKIVFTSGVRGTLDIYLKLFFIISSALTFVLLCEFMLKKDTLNNLK